MMNLIRLDDELNNGGKVTSASEAMKFDGRQVARKGVKPLPVQLSSPSPSPGPRLLEIPVVEFVTATGKSGPLAYPALG